MFSTQNNFCKSRFLFLFEGNSHKVHKRDAGSSENSKIQTHSVPRNVSFYLSCPIHSYHAVYNWKHHDKTSPCLQMHSNCLHLIPSMNQEHYGTYDCVSTEKDYTKVVNTYELKETIYPEPRKDSKTSSTQIENSASSLVPLVIWLTLLIAAL